MITLAEMEGWITALKKAESAALEIGAATLAGDLSEIIDAMEYATDDLRGAELDRQQLAQMEGPTARERDAHIARQLIEGGID